MLGQSLYMSLFFGFYEQFTPKTKTILLLVCRTNPVQAILGVTTLPQSHTDANVCPNTKSALS